MALLKITDRKELSTVDSISGKKKKKNPLEMKGKSRHSQMKKNLKKMLITNLFFKNG